MFTELFSRGGLSLDRLRTLVEVSDAGGIAPAVRERLSRQPSDSAPSTVESNFSHQLSDLGEFFGVHLTRRKGKGIELTEAGAALASLARSHLSSLEDFLSETRNLPIELRLGSNNTVIGWLLAPILPELSRALNGARFTVRGMRSRNIADGLIDCSLDLGFVRESAILSRQLDTSPFASLHYCLFARPGLAKRFGNDAREILRGTPIATSMGGEFRQRLDSSLEGEGIRPDLRYSCSSFREVQALLIHDQSVAAILPDTARRDLPEKQFARIDLPFLEDYRRDLVLAWNPRNVAMRSGVKEAIDLFRRSFPRPVE